jgi:small subunit ribosomal protein S4
MIRKHNKFSRPKHAFDAERIKQENVIVKKYGLKNKKEIWKAKAKLDIIRRQAKKLINASEEEQKKYLNRLNVLGYKVENTVEILSLTEEDILKRRLQTIVFKKGVATTLKSARQMIVHKNILVGDRIVNIPSYNVKVEEEAKIIKKVKQKKVAKEEKKE